MPRLITVKDVKQLVNQVGLRQFFLDLIAQLKEDYAHWQNFEKQPRHATHYPHGVIELMPISDDVSYAFKYVNGHPYNPQKNKQTVTAVGMLAGVDTGYPTLISEMTVLTAFRTAATSALAAEYLANKNVKTLTMIGTGAQGEFQTLALHYALGCGVVRYFDKDPAAMHKFAHNLKDYGLALHACKDAAEAVAGGDIISTATADKAKAEILKNDWIKPGMMLNALGGDCPGKTEIPRALLERSKIVVEYMPQTLIEGEIQHLTEEHVYAELWELVQGVKPGRTSSDEITLFDSVGFAIEDLSVLKYVQRLANEFNVGEVVDLIPDIDDPKNLFSCIMG